MTTFDDTGICAPESVATLLIQQAQLATGRRDVQMFPVGTDELPLLDGFCRHQNARGVFHFNPEKITAEKIDDLSSRGMENEFLNLGPYSKREIAKRIMDGEKFTAITEYDPDGTEIRCAGGTDKTADVQREYFERTKDSGNVVVVGAPPPRVASRLVRDC